jgi:hypothetical protein
VELAAVELSASLAAGLRILRSIVKGVIMKALLAAATVVIALTPFTASFATTSDSAMQDCFSKHAQQMDKPALKNMRDCWQTHGYEMDKS